jgi:uncharacterized membrane protein HdeD (DUF308 family)
MSNSKVEADALRLALATSLHEHRVFYLVEGIVLMCLGAAAIIVPPVATLAVTIFLGWLFLVSGIVGLFTTFWMRGVPGFWWSLTSAILAIVVGVLLIGWPIAVTLPLTFLLVAFFLIEGVASIMFALDHRRELSAAWGSMLASGIVDLVLGGLIFAGLPSTAAWALGLLVGINMVLGGVALIAMALRARRIDPISAAI